MSGDKQGTIALALREGRARLSDAGVDTPGLDAEVLLRYVLGIDRATLFARRPEPIAAMAYAQYRTLLDERASGVPVAYLTGEREFMGLLFSVAPVALIPRPETEIIVEWALRWLRSRDRAIVVDVGTGTGAIALSIASGMGDDWGGRIIATDVSTEALAIAARNRARFGVADRVELRQGSLLTPVAESVDLIVANLPYLRPDQISANRQLAAEPRLALDGGAEGLDLIRQLLVEVPRVLIRGGAMGLEIDPSQREAVVRFAHDAFPTSSVDVLQDLAGLDRHVVIQTPIPPVEDRGR